MIYVLDDNSLSNILKFYFESRFPTFWDRFDDVKSRGRVISTHEVRAELGDKFSKEQIARLAEHSSVFFPDPTLEEMAFIREIYSVRHFQHNLTRKKLLQGGPFADPFVIAKAKVIGGSVVTEEEYRPNAARIPNICEHFGIPCVCLEGFMEKEDWRF